MKRPLKPPASPIEAAYARIGGKWKPVILHQLKDGTRRFNDLRRQIPNITQRALTLQLRELETDGFVRRKVFRQIPPRVEYSLTEHGHTLLPWLSSLEAWALEHAWPPDGGAPEQRPHDGPDRAQIEPEPPSGIEAGPETVEAAPQHEQSPEPKPAQSPPQGRPWGAAGAIKIR